jgi:ABC-type sulfate transport system permease component
MVRRALQLTYRQATASKVRCVVFSVLLAWALLDAALTYRGWADLPLYARLFGFVGSLLLSLIFVSVLAMIWDWIARRVRGTSTTG